MRIVIVGAGGVGGLMGGLLARGGSEVAFVARGAWLEALRSKGLRVEGPVGDFSTPPLEASESPEKLGSADVVMVAVKAWQVSALAPSLKPLLAGGGFVLPLQNGLEAHDQLAAALGEENVVGGLCHLFSQIASVGVIKQSGFAPSVTFGEWRGGGSERLEKLRAELGKGAITGVIAPNVQAALWEKAQFVEALGAVGSVLRLPVGAWRGQAESRALMEGALRETEAVARAGGVELGQAAFERAMTRVDGLPAEATASMQRDIVGGRPSELDDQTAAIVRIAEQRGVAVPLHRFLLACLLPHERAARAAAGKK